MNATFFVDQTSSAFGLFVLAYTRLFQEIAGAQWHIQRRIETALSYQEVLRTKADVLLSQFSRELRTFPESEARVHLQRAVEAADVLRRWRNAYVHCFVVRVGDSFALYDRNGDPLRLELGDIHAKLAEVNRIELEFGVHLPMLLEDANVRAMIHDFIEDLIG